MRIAIFGAGQLAMMMIEASSDLGHEFIVIDPASQPPASKLAKHYMVEYNDEEILKFVASECDIATIDFENVDISALKYLENHIKVSPPSNALKICQDRLYEKKLFTELGINVTEYHSVNNINDIEDIVFDDKSNYLLKSRRFGYDGKNQLKCDEEKELLNNLLSKNDCIIEKIVDFTTEVSLICVRQDEDTIFFYPLVENFHRSGILRYSIFPYSNASLQDIAEEYATNLLNYFNYVGVLVIEFFVSNDGSLIANEMAPRVHNSGHWSIEGCSISQFESHIRAITGQLSSFADDFKPSIMMNILSKYPKPEKISELGEHYMHSYNKEERDLRKLGHITKVADQKEELLKDLKRYVDVLDN